MTDDVQTRRPACRVVILCPLVDRMWGANGAFGSIIAINPLPRPSVMITAAAPTRLSQPTKSDYQAAKS